MKKLVLLPFVFFACERYEAPPEPSIVGLSQGTLSDSRAPIVVDFGEPIDPATLKITVAFRETDIEGNLFDEDDDPQTNLRVLKTQARVDGAQVTLNHDRVFPVGPKLILIVEPGLKSKSGAEELHYRAKVPFSYGVTCTGGPTRLASGKYFMFLTVENPLPVQLQVYAELTVDPKSGAVSGKFTSAERRTDQTCPTACEGVKRCRLLPFPDCVPPSSPAGSPDEFPDWAPNPTPPTGFEFEAEGCAADNADGTGVLTAPTTMTVQSPAVTVYGLAMTSSFAPDAAGIVRASGTLRADSIVLGTQNIGAGTGTLTARQIP
jgi:hypothetical protein